MAVVGSREDAQNPVSSRVDRRGGGPIAWGRETPSSRSFLPVMVLGQGPGREC